MIDSVTVGYFGYGALLAGGAVLLAVVLGIASAYLAKTFSSMVWGVYQYAYVATALSKFNKTDPLARYAFGPVKDVKNKKDALEISDLTDKQLGRVFRKLANEIGESSRTLDREEISAALMLTCCNLAKMNYTAVDVTLKGVEEGADKLGDWSISIKRI